MSPSSPEDGPSSEPSVAAASPAHEPLACVSCRSRKLKCDRQKPVCARCAKSNGECVYPESRRKPAFKRRNVRELEERLAQVEGLLKTVGKQRASQSARSDGAWTEDSSPGASFRPDRLQGSPREGAMPWFPMSPTDSPAGGDSAQSGELLGLGQFERLPPFEMIEELHTIFFATQQHFMPIIHPGNYLRSFHSPPHMRPPMCLQYAIWTAASNGHPKYGCYHDALYRRARQYLEADELKGAGEHFITVGHAQAWALVASDEARCLMFTRASMSSARSVRLAGMMGLHRLDSTLPEEDVPLAPMIPPARGWAELEERRRLFWGGFTIDCYASISAGWPTLIDVEQITTHLPSSEDAFKSGEEEKTSTLKDAFRGANYSTFAANVIVCHIFSRLMKHAHRPLPDDRPEDPENGPFWKRHRELDNMLSSIFMFLPERFRLQRNMRDPIAVQTNLNLHAAVICLHNVAVEKADKFKLGGIRQASRTRALTAAQEIVEIMTATGHIKTGHKGPLMALSLYFAATAYTAQAKDNPEDFNKANLEQLLKWMNILGHHAVIMRSYLRQIMTEIESNGIDVTVEGELPSFEVPATVCGHGIPLVARGPSSRHVMMQSPLPGRLPLGAPQGTIPSSHSARFVPFATFIGPYSESKDTDRTDDTEGPASKRMRTTAGPSSGVSARKRAHEPESLAGPSTWSAGQGQQTFVDPAPDFFEYVGSGWSYATKYMTNMPTTTLPHRTGSPAIHSRGMQTTTATNTIPTFPGFLMPGSSTGAAGPSSFPQMPGPGPSTTAGLGSAASGVGLNVTNNPMHSTLASLSSEELGDLGVFENLGEWGVTDAESFYAMLLDVSGGAGTSQDDIDPWAALNDAGGGGGAGSGSG